MTQTWLVTGASSGLGTAIAEAALQAGHKVIATARNPTKAAQENPQVEKLGGIWIELDVTKSETTKRVEDAITQTGGVIDVVVNNAGYSLLGSIEDMSESEVETQFNTNVHGPVRVLKGVLPFMRAQKSGTIVNISSSAGLDGLPTCAMYAGTKFALEAMSESLSRELEPFGIRVVIIEPGQFRTKFLASYVQPAAGMNKAYLGTPLDDVMKFFKQVNGSQHGDPVKAAQRILEIVSGTGMAAGKDKVLRFPLGPDCYKRFQTKIESMQSDWKETQEIAHSTNYE
ncbi:hypothetical protein N7468_002809 [Penicillium chermesinum]|uniref:Uncharacterized protein n=1 Tax=Penicillium chermesinum TaxID=63820 RepID=A0A9W9PKW5_9EURO|nr:uncharacterized protein N7468_002809 [Penicillium chermesinum]KAJ5247826.1 hypothetical protein N7468_002809 [Penicillium chermesinum]KAJ6151587.1 hypothetical protein N7470_007184 [Penicillium chermesinum]